MNLPNKITVSRVCLIPLFMLVVLIDFGWGNITLIGDSIPVNHLVGAGIFIIASVTDFIDGYYARKFNLVTNFGKFLDPLADKLLVSSALIILTDFNYVPAWITIVIISREFAVTGLRMILAGTGEVHAAAMLGKIKTWAQIVAISAYFLHDFPFNFLPFSIADVALWVALFFTVYSGWDYFYKNRDVLIKSM
ncbi:MULTISPECIES: CDP-diacylglycerol--glycerol-3-phosphate 3-phosphatidyltransferase [unclassified Bacillus (in: firmicutes)]|uniref:CDP-diacylglycerol--glycerol-3-phosphate 3-phosphatidyltransferase n=1 Tax=unclassified Bacillus (in: firmicutes) TaxID=185979 RepID=UPI000BF18F73|nr:MULTISPECIES: CDP-diacylglycerol--glycerol-3-phosphate 3-phosphatidyltransferase [unclassified Bacillus (in: firmicutes)]PEJ60184.1 CDP-diacylglycerol--glycerol-3-phosphate 3-phosphatidyltransferase [Bacillus sp. AFS002410]PEK98588.1 CDP-diacylglycerol--glycerol-3-phosphate 3-phosphatidyltransferase [Bacillus sp. AFS017336]